VLPNSNTNPADSLNPPGCIGSHWLGAVHRHCSICTFALLYRDPCRLSESAKDTKPALSYSKGHEDSVSPLRTSIIYTGMIGEKVIWLGQERRFAGLHSATTAQRPWNWRSISEL
jgi:hypothetical protein